MDPVSTACSVTKILSSCVAKTGEAANAAQESDGISVPPINASPSVDVGVSDSCNCCSPISFKRKNKNRPERSQSEESISEPKVDKTARARLENGQTVSTRGSKIEISVTDLGVEQLTDSRKMRLINRLSGAFKRGSMSTEASPSHSTQPSPNASKRGSRIDAVGSKVSARGSIEYASFLEKKVRELQSRIESMELETLTDESLTDSDSD